MYLGSLTHDSRDPSAGADRCLRSSCNSFLSSLGWTGSPSERSGGFREGRVAARTSLLGLVLGGAPGIRFTSGHLIPEGDEKVAQKCRQSDRVTVNKILMELFNNVEFAG